MMGVMAALEERPSPTSNHMVPTLTIPVDNLTELPRDRTNCRITLDEHILINCDDFLLLESFKRLKAAISDKITKSDIFREELVTNERSKGRYISFNHFYGTRVSTLTYDKDMLYYYSVLAP